MRTVWKYYNPNPAGRNVGDCAVRAVAAALRVDWEDAFRLLAQAAFDMANMPDRLEVISAVLRKAGFYRSVISNGCPERYTAEDFCREYPRGVYVLDFGAHVATVRDGVIWDSSDVSQEIPSFFWYLKEM